MVVGIRPCCLHVPEFSRHLNDWGRHMIFYDSYFMGPAEPLAVVDS